MFLAFGRFLRPREVVSTGVTLAVALVFIGISLRVANQSDPALMFHLVISVLSVSMLPVLLVCELASRSLGMAVT